MRTIATLALALVVVGCKPSADMRGFTRYIPLVGQIKSTYPRIEKDLHLRLDDLADLKTLRPVKPGETFKRGRGVGNVFVRQTDGNFIISIQTIDNGHGGEEGYVYSDLPIEVSDYGSGWLMANVPGHLCLTTSDRQIDPNWWVFVYNLD